MGKSDDEKRHVAPNELGRAHNRASDEALVQYQAATVDPQDASLHYNISVYQCRSREFAEISASSLDKAADLIL